MEVKKLDFGETLKDSVAIGVKNAPSVIAAVALWLITIWIPYLNVGTTIAITLLPTQLAKGEIVNPLGIFDSKYRRYMGEFFITMGLMVFPIFIGVLFMVIPGIVLSIAWTLSYYFLIEKGKNPIQAIKASNDATYGSKWTMFFVSLVVGVLFGIVFGIFREVALVACLGYGCGCSRALFRAHVFQLCLELVVPFAGHVCNFCHNSCCRSVPAVKRLI